MSDQNTIWQELTGLAAGIIVGAMIIVIGRFLFSSGAIATYNTNWVQTNYDPAAIIVFLASTIFATAWFLITLKWWPTFSPQESIKARSIWFLLFVLPILSLVMALFIWGKEDDQPLQLLAFIVLLVILSLGMLFSYWVTTALSTPRNMCHVVPLASLFRR